MSRNLVKCTANRLSLDKHAINFQQLSQLRDTLRGALYNKIMVSDDVLFLGCLNGDLCSALIIFNVIQRAINNLAFDNLRDRAF